MKKGLLSGLLVAASIVVLQSSVQAEDVILYETTVGENGSSVASVHPDGTDSHVIIDGSVTGGDTVIIASDAADNFVTFSDRDGGELPSLEQQNSQGAFINQVVDNAAAMYDASYSADGQNIAVAIEEENGFQIYGGSANGSLSQLTSNDGNHYYPAYSPDGQKIAYTQQNVDCGCAYDLYVMGSNGANRTPLVQIANFTIFNPTWALDNLSIFFEAGGLGSFGDLYRVNLADQVVTNLTNTPFVQEFDTVLAPNGAKLAYTAYDIIIPGVYSIGTYSIADGVDQIILAGSPQIGFSSVNYAKPVWSPDSTQLLIHNFGTEVTFIFFPEFEGLGFPVSTSFSRLVIANSDGSELRTLSTIGTIGQNPSYAWIRINDPVADVTPTTSTTSTQKKGSIFAAIDDLLFPSVAAATTEQGQTSSTNTDVRQYNVPEDRNAQKLINERGLKDYWIYIILTLMIVGFLYLIFKRRDEEQN